MFRIVVLEKTLESPLDCKEVKPVNPKGRQPWISIGRTVAEAPILWPPDLRSWLIGKDSDAGKDWRQKERAWQRMRWSDSITNSMDVNLSKLGHIVKDRGAWRATVHGVAKSRTWLRDWKIATTKLFSCYIGGNIGLFHVRCLKLPLILSWSMKGISTMKHFRGELIRTYLGNGPPTC